MLYRGKTEEELKQMYPLFSVIKLNGMESIIYSHKVGHSNHNLYSVIMGGTMVYNKMTDTWAEVIG